MSLATIILAVGVLQSNTVIVYDTDTKDAIIFDAGGDIRMHCICVFLSLTLIPNSKNQICNKSKWSSCKTHILFISFIFFDIKLVLSFY